MTVKTLLHIHNLLIDSERQAHEEKSLLWKARRSAERNESPDAKELKEQYNQANEKWLAASNALDDFEEHDWH